MKQLLILSLFIPFTLFATDKLILEKIAKLEEQIALLKAEVKQNAKLQQQVYENTQDIAENQPILDKVETKTILDKINFSPELELRTDKMDYTNNSIEGETTHINGDPTQPLRRTGYVKHFKPAVTIKAALNMNAQLNNVTSFHGKMLFTNTTQSNERLCILSRDIKSQSSSSAFDLTKAYFDYRAVGSDYTFSFGVLPTTDGTPSQFSVNKKRSSLFPSLVFNMNTYGVILTKKIEKDTFVRGVLAKAYTLRDVFYPYQCNRENIDNATVMGLYTDTSFHFLGDALLSFGINYLKDLKAHPYLGPDVTANNAHVLGDMITLGAGIDIQKFMDTKTTLFLHSALSNPHPNGAIDDYQITNPTAGTTASGITGFSEASYAKGTMVSKNGYAFYLGSKYDLNSAINFGAEYNYGSKYWFSATQGSQDMYNKVAIRGNALEAYINWLFTKNMFVKFGFLYMSENYTGSGWHFGEPAKKDAHQTNSYISINAKF